MQPIRPKFEKPPLVEQAITVIFQDIDKFSIGDFGLFWHQIQDEFPMCEARPLLEPIVEDFDEFSTSAIQFRLMPQDTLPRCFYRRADGAELIQLQRDRFTFNWSVVGGGEYPSFEVTQARFRVLFDKFIKFLSEREYGPIVPRQCEVTNVNVVRLQELGSTFSAVEMAFNVTPNKPNLALLGFEHTTIQTQFLIKGSNESDKPIGRLHSSLAPARAQGDDQLAWRYELTARSTPLNALTDVYEFFGSARSAINSAFMAGTTEWAHKRWGMIDGN